MSVFLPVAVMAGAALLMAAVFIALWWGDKRRSDQIQADPERLDTGVDASTDADIDEASRRGPGTG